MVKIYLEVYGCSVNLSEAEIMKGLLAKKHELVNSPENAEIVIVSICSVKGDMKALRRLRELKTKFKKTFFIVAGCIPENLVEELKKYGSLISTHNISKILDVVEATLEGKSVEVIGKNATVKINLPKIRHNKIIAIVPISSGCYSACTYCSVRLIKGKLISYPQEMIITEIKTALAEGCKEIWITAQDTVCYGLENSKKSLLPKLLEEIVKIEGDFFVRVGMMNPKHVIPVLNEMIESFKSEKIFKFLHIPIQSGNNETLNNMKRGYTVSEFETIVEAFRKEFPMITISTDIICGFPGESEEQFKETLELIEKLKPAVLNISRFVPREGTEAAIMKQIPSWIIKERSRKLTKLFDQIAFNQNKKWIGWEGNILIDEIGKYRTFIGRNFAYKPIIVKEKRLGSMVNAKIKEVTKYDLKT